MVDTYYPNVGSRIEMEMDEKIESVELTPPSDKIEDEDVAQAMKCMDVWIIRQLHSHRRELFDIVKRVAEAAQNLIRAAEPKAMDFSGGAYEYGNNVLHVGGRGQVIGGGMAGDGVDIVRQMVGMLQPNLEARNGEAEACARRQQAAELADLMIAIKEVPAGREFDPARFKIDKRIQVLLATLDTGEPPKTDDRPLGAVSEQTQATGGDVLIACGARLDEEGVHRCTQPIGHQGLHNADQPLPDVTATNPSIKPGSKWRQANGGAFHVKVEAAGPNDAGQQLVSFTVHPDNGCTDVSMPMQRGVLFEREFREHYRFSDDPVPAQPAMSASLRSDLLAQAQARKFTEAASGIDMHIMSREVKSVAGIAAQECDACAGLCKGANKRGHCKGFTAKDDRDHKAPVLLGAPFDPGDD